jgi:membrane protease YdiL (CAAX protease family)
MQRAPLNRPTESPFRAWDFLIVFGISLAFSVFGAIVLFVVAPPQLPSGEMDVGSLAAYLAESGAFWALAYAQWIGTFIGLGVVGAIRRAKATDFGLPIEASDLRGAAWGFGALGVLILFGVLLDTLGVEVPVQEVAGAIAASEGPLLMLAAVLGAGVMAPITEELLYRGVLQGALRRRFPPVTAIALTSAVFAVTHVQGGSLALVVGVLLVPIFALSLLLGWLVERDGGRIGRAFFAHAAYNSVQVLLLFSGLAEL